MSINVRRELRCGIVAVRVAAFAEGVVAQAFEHGAGFAGDRVHRTQMIRVQITRVAAVDEGVELEPRDIEDFAEVQIMLATRIKQREQEFEKGILTDEAKLLHRQLQLRFGTLAASVEEKLAHATRAGLEQWGAKILSAVTLDAEIHLTHERHPRSV